MKFVLKKNLNILAVLLLLALTAGVAWGGTPRCSVCRQPVAAKYYTQGDMIYCSACYKKKTAVQSLPRCSVCRRPIRAKGYSKGNRTYCLACYKKIAAQYLPRCSVCHKPIQGQLFTKDSTTYCSVCYEKSLPRCSSCLKPIEDNYYRQGDKILCSDCYNYDRSLPVCVCCRKKLADNKYRRYRGGVTACDECINNKKNPRCTVCDAPLGYLSAKPVPYYGVYVCEKHRPEIVVDQEAALALMQQVRKDMVSALGEEMNISRNVILKLVSKEDLHKAYGIAPDSKAVGFCRPQGNYNIVYIQGGMSRSATYAAMAHELGHAWQNENNFVMRHLPGLGAGGNRFVEGFAEWVAYKTTEAFGDKRELRGMLNKTNDNYRLGLRDFLQYEKENGKDAVLEAAKTRSSL